MPIYPFDPALRASGASAKAVSPVGCPRTPECSPSPFPVRYSLFDIPSLYAALKRAVLPVAAALALCDAVDSSAGMIGTYNNGVSSTEWSDDGSYGIKVDNRLDEVGNVRILEYTKVTDSNFTRDSFTLNSDYTKNPLNRIFTNGGFTNGVYRDRISDDGTLDSGNGWFLVDNGDGTENINHSGRNYKVPELGDYAVVESNIKAQDILDHIAGTYVNANGVLLNRFGSPFLQLETQESEYDWNGRQRSMDGLDYVESNGRNGEGFGVIPEPGTLPLFGIASLGALALRRLFRG